MFLEQPLWKKAVSKNLLGLCWTQAIHEECKSLHRKFFIMPAGDWPGRFKQVLKISLWRCAFYDCREGCLLSFEPPFPTVFVMQQSP